MIARPTTGEAVDAACALVESLAPTSRTTQRDFVGRSDSVAFTGTYARATAGRDAWLGPCLWNGAVPYLGAPAIALVGSAEDVASTILGYQRMGVSQFLFMGWPDIDEMSFFSESVAAAGARPGRVGSLIMLRFHWRLPQGGERPNASRAHQASLPETGLPDLDAQVPFARAAEVCGIDSLLLDFGWSKPDPILIAAALGLSTTSMRFIIAHRSGLMCPTTFVQQLNTLSALIGDRFSLNIVAGHSPEEQRGYGDFLAHDERYARTDEYLAVCRALWTDPRDVTFQGRYHEVEHARRQQPVPVVDAGVPRDLHGRELAAGPDAERDARLVLDAARGHAGPGGRRRAAGDRGRARRRPAVLDRGPVDAGRGRRRGARPRRVGGRAVRRPRRREPIPGRAAIRCRCGRWTRWRTTSG